jgi:ornithine cyclodeaminase/alanine dehydrogenase
MSEGQLLYLSRDDVVGIGLPMSEVIAGVETAFREKGEGRTEMPPKPGIHPGGGDNFIHAMPAYVPGLRSAGLKWVSGFPGNAERGLPYISGLLILNDVDTGLPLAVMDCTWITAMRTGAATAVAARRLARPESSILGVLGCGVQGRSNLEALTVVLPIAHVQAYDPAPGAAAEYAAEVSDRFGVTVAVAASPREAVSGCDVVVTAGPIQKHPHRTIQRGWLDAGAFASLVDYDSYFDPAALHEADKFCTDDVPQLRLAQTAGYFADIPPIHADLGELVTRRKPGRERPEERTIAANLGLAIDDMAVAPGVYGRALDSGTGTWLPL